MRPKIRKNLRTASLNSKFTHSINEKECSQHFFTLATIILQQTLLLSMAVYGT